MRALRASASIALTIVACQALAVAQTSPPATGTPPASAAPPPNYPPPPGAQPPSANDPPPPGYQQPPPGYQQQPPPGYQQPPPGYSQPPPGYSQPPPPGYYQPPPPGYYPPAAYGYPQAPPPPRPPPRTHGFLALPYIGVTTFAGQSNAPNPYGTGFALGTLVGGRLNPSFSLNGELRMDAINFRNVPSGEKWEAFEFDFDLSPLFHVPFATGEMVVGPKLGFAGYDETDTMTNGLETFRQHWSGFSAGFNAGVFFAVSRVMSLGGMFSFTIRDPSQVCGTIAGQTEHCQTADFHSEKVFGFQAGALF